MTVSKTLLISISLVSLLSCTTNDKIKFAFVTDTHVGRNKTAWKDLQQTVEDINSMTDIDFIVITGDIANSGSDKQLEETKTILDKLNKKWYIFPGNHDTKWSESGCTSFKKIFGEERFSFKCGKYYFVGCGSGPEMRMGPGMVSYNDVVWLDSVITRTADDPVFFLNHYPVNESLNNWYKVIDILKKGNIQGIFCGHGHKNKKMNFEGIPGVMGRSNLRAEEKNGGYNIVTIENDSIFFAERTPKVKTHKIWNSFKLTRFVPDDKIYPRPSYKINSQYPGVKELWSIQDSSDIVSGVTATDSSCFYTNTRGYIVALNANTGTLLWKFKTGGKIFSTPALTKNAIVSASTDGCIYCLESNTGRLLWKYPTSKAIVASPVIEGNIVYIGSSEGKIRALSLLNGSLIWENDSIHGFIETKPLIDKIHIYFGDWSDHFYALNKKDGTIDWQWGIGNRSNFFSPAACFPVSAEGKIFIVAPDHYTTAFDANTGKQIWRSNKYNGRESIGVSEDKSLIYIKTIQDSVVAVSSLGKQFETKWIVNCNFGFELDPAPLIEKDGVLFVPCNNGYVYAIDRESQKIRWTRKLSNALVNNIYPLGHKQLLVSMMDGKIFKLEYD